MVPEDKRERLMDVDLPLIPLLPGDFIWLVEYEDLGIVHQRLGQTDPLAIPLRQIAQKTAAHLGEAAALREIVDGSPRHASTRPPPAFGGVSSSVDRNSPTTSSSMRW